MPPPLYLDECVSHTLIALLHDCGIVLTTARAEGLHGLPDEVHLDFAARTDRLLVTHDGRDFWRCHRRFREAGRGHGGIVTLPTGGEFPPDQRVRVVVTRIRLLLAWIATFPDRHHRFFRWADLQYRLTQGERLPGFSEAEVRLALGQGR